VSIRGSLSGRRALNLFGRNAQAFLRSSLWIVSVACMAAALAVAPLIRWIDERTHWSLLGFGAEGARAVVGALSASLLTFIVFIFSILLLVVQIAGAQLSPRVISRPFESRMTKFTLGVFVFAYAYSLTALGRIETEVPQLSVLIAVLASLFSIALFLYLIQNIGEGFRPNVVLTGVAEDTARMIEATYPTTVSSAHVDAPVPKPDSSDAARSIALRSRSSVVVAFHIPRLVELASDAQCRIELVPRIGDFLATGDTVCRLRGRGAAMMDAAEVERCVMLAVEPTLEQDPLVGVRIIVDIALKALSPDINDPATGVAAIDQLHHLLNLVGHRHFPPGLAHDSTGELRVLYRTSQWEDFVALAVSEVHAFAGQSPQVHRRFRSMIAQLIRTLPEARALQLRGELEQLDRMIEADQGRIGVGRSADSLRRAAP
jgi:uncharacterized membrane protein